MTRYIQLRLSSEPSRILHADDDHVAVEIAIIVARDMALHGHFHDSAAILAAAWSPAEYGGGVDRTFSLDFVYDTVDRIGLDLIWRGAKFTPTDVPDWASRLEQLGYTESQIEMKQRFYFCAVEHSTAPSILVDSSIAARWHEVQVMLAIRTDPMTGSQSFPDPELELQALSMLEVFIEQSVPLVHEWPDSRPHALALDLALKYHDWDLARKMLGLIGTRILNLASSAAQDLALTLRAGQIAADTSILESITGLTKARAREVTIEVVNALKTRLSFGEPRPYADLSWATLLYEIEAREVELQEDEHEVVIPFLRRPASPGRIVLAETQLGIQLPQDYKDFLAVSDGIGSYNLTQTTPLLPVDEIFWDTDRQSLKVEYRRFETSNYQTHRTGQLPVLQRVLQISEADDEAATHWWLIEPSLVASAKRSMGENALPTWLGVNYADWNPVFSNRGSFRIMMERRLSALAQRTP